MIKYLLIRKLQSLVSKSTKKDFQDEVNDQVVRLLERTLASGKTDVLEKVFDILDLGEDTEQRWENVLMNQICSKCLRSEFPSRILALIFNKLFFPKIKGLKSPAT